MKNNESLNIVLAGDICPTGKIEELCHQNKLENIFGNTLDFFAKSDISIANLECPLTSAHNPIPKLGPNLISDPKCIALFKYAKIDVAALANNHIMDQGIKGLQDTIEICKKAGVETVGAGMHMEEASEPLYINKKGKTVAIINCAENEFSIAGRNIPGANPLNLTQIYYAVIKAKKNTDTIIVVLHGGHEHYQFPSPRMVEEYRYIADLGVTAVICHHTHCISGYEWHNDVPIIYSLGNFLFEGNKTVSEQWHKGIISELLIKDGRVQNLNLHPFVQCKENVTVELMTGEHREKCLDDINKISNVIKNKEQLEDMWRQFIENKLLEYMPPLLTMGRYRRYLFKRGFDICRQSDKNKILHLLNYIRCEAHRDVSIDVLKQWLKKG